ncbi:MAG: VOC family protein [Gemmatimonadota bacterium]|nr:VOC family protein [Gemmatimonadota bacterium]
MSSDETPTEDQPRRSTPETLRLRRVTPSLTVDDINESLKFYKDILGCVVDEIWEHEGRRVGAALVAGSVTLLLTQDDGEQGTGRIKGQGMRLHVSTAQDIDRLAANVRERGGDLHEGPADMPWGARAFTVVDPDGFKLTIAQER